MRILFVGDIVGRPGRRAMKSLLPGLRRELDIDGRVSAVVGTHTHVATADQRILPKGTAYVTDLGMVGPMNSVIGDEPEDVLARFLYQTPRRLGIPSGPVRFNPVLVELDAASGRATSIQRVDSVVE